MSGRSVIATSLAEHCRSLVMKAGVAVLHEVLYLWRPVLRDPKDDFLLKLAVGAGFESIVTFNLRDFEAAQTIDLRVEEPRAFLKRIGEGE